MSATDCRRRATQQPKPNVQGACRDADQGLGIPPTEYIDERTLDELRRSIISDGFDRGLGTALALRESSLQAYRLRWHLAGCANSPQRRRRRSNAFTRRRRLKISAQSDG